MEFCFWTVFMIICLMSNSAQGRRTSRELSDIAIRTVESEDGDVIHCIDIYKQPVLYHPLLENHTIELVPSFHSEETNRSSEEKIFQTWQKNGSCPEGTVPMLNPRTKQENSTFLSLNALQRVDPPRFEFAGYISTPESGLYTGVKGRFSVCSPVFVNENEYTTAAVSVEANSHALQLGWMIYPRNFGDYSTRLFVYWSTVNQVHGVINLDSPGFVHTSRNVALGASLIQNNNSHENNNLALFTIRKDNRGQKWWAILDKEPIGYWPVSIVPQLHSAAEIVGWTGMVFNTAPGGHHTTTQMGNGVHPDLGASTSYGPGPASAFVDEMGVLPASSSSEAFVPPSPFRLVNFPRCYSAVLLRRGRSRNNVGMTMYYGGSGRSGCDAVDG